ncbi:hypothetical protein NAC44_07160 [Allorhizobium sp. BGMRC 0089]|uniref:hypothetical protein n=1 Tax=Allorhizobium sonneratiae TaxID=2934936 RepID=UPI002033FAC2|nr:hypothetical protein [Allorhizobium sonneratiae]MCM2292110.1 hypothetical protein [Allorhizobium sonneratiae]
MNAAKKHPIEAVLAANAPFRTRACDTGLGQNVVSSFRKAEESRFLPGFIHG